MKGKVKKNQLIIVALAVMIAAAGYLNYTGRLFGENAKGTKEAMQILQIRNFWIFHRKIQKQKAKKLKVMILKQKEHLERRF